MAGARDLVDLAVLMRWLGPWAGDAVPSGIERSTRAPGGTGKAYVYRAANRSPAGAYLISPGLHFLGPDDPRLDRFCRVLAAAGLLVYAPFLPAFLRLRLDPATTDHLAAALDDLDGLAAGHGLSAPAVFSISFGSMPAIELAARASHRDRLGALVLFGGFADFAATVRFAVSGLAENGTTRIPLTRDPLNSPAVFLNLLPYLDVESADAALLEEAWMTMARRTWGRMELKAQGARDPFAHAVAATLPARLRDLFLVGCGLLPGAVDHVSAGLTAAGEAFAFFDPRPHLPRVRAPVHLLHARDDDVIPYFESEKLRAHLAPGHPHEMRIVGMASHTGVTMPRPRELGRELYTMLASARAICHAPRR
jgi:pimeloyl-ACP methyl ester carboxylesterase